jgi:hypothetical protein
MFSEALTNNMRSAKPQKTHTTSYGFIYLLFQLYLSCEYSDFTIEEFDSYIIPS